MIIMRAHVFNTISMQGDPGEWGIEGQPGVPGPLVSPVLPSVSCQSSLVSVQQYTCIKFYEYIMVVVNFENSRIKAAFLSGI